MPTFLHRRTLESLIRSAKPEIEAPPRILDRVRSAATAQPQEASLAPVTRRRTLVAALAVALLLGGAFTLRGPLQARRGGHLLITAAAAAADATTMHTWGWLRLPAEGGGWQQPVQYEAWVSGKDGWLWNSYRAGGTLRISQGMDVAEGYLWQYEPERQRAAIRRVLQPKEMRFPSGELKSPYGSPGFSANLMDSDWAQQQLDEADGATTYGAQVNGTPVTVVALEESSWTPQGQQIDGRFRREFCVDSSGIFLGQRGIAESAEGETVVAEEWHEYNLSIPAATFTFTPPEGVRLYEYDLDRERGDLFGFTPLPWKGE